MTVSPGTMTPAVGFGLAYFPAGARNARREHRRRKSRAASRPDDVGRHGYGVHTGRVAAHVARSAAAAAAAIAIPAQRDDRQANGT